VRHCPQKIRRLVRREHCGQMIQQLAGEALQLEQIDEILFAEIPFVHPSRDPLCPSQ
jgi:hypothetical protein